MFLAGPATVGYRTNVKAYTNGAIMTCEPHDLAMGRLYYLTRSLKLVLMIGAPHGGEQ